MRVLGRALFGALVLLAWGAVPAAHAQEQLVELVTELLQGTDKDLRAVALDQIRKEAKGEAATRKFAELLPKFPAETQIGLLGALADRGDAAAAPAVRALFASSQDEAVRIAVIKALGPLGGRDDLPVLVEAMASPVEALQGAARDSLVRLPVEASDAMVAEMRRSPPPMRIELLRILTTRRTRSAVDEFLAAAAEDDAGVRQAAVQALSELADVDQLPGLMTLVLKTPAGRERDAIERAIVAACDRVENQDERAAPVIAALPGYSPADRNALLSTLGRIGGAAALEVVDAAVASSDVPTHVAGIRALCNWPDGAVVARLLRVARTDADEAQRKLALQALIRIAPLADDRTDPRRLDTLRTALAMCATDAERNQVLDRAKAVRTVDTLRFLLPSLDQPAYAQQACLTIVELAHHSKLRESHREEFHQALDRVIATSKNATVVDRAQRYKKGETWVRPKSAE